jgi:Acyl-CoA dehydrogenase, C-terminal domain
VEFEFDEDQLLLRQTVRETVAKTRTLPEDELWATYTGLGWLEAPPVELAIVLDELGYVADPTPFLATATWFAPLAGRLPGGAGTGVFDGAGRFVLDADRADEVALLTAGGVVVVPGAELAAQRLDTFDLRLHVAHVTAVPPMTPGDLVPGVPDLALMGLAATTVGACRRILDLVVAHVKQRQQFGVPIGSFQAVKHAAATMLVAVESSRTITYFAAASVEQGGRESGLHAAAAKAQVTAAAEQAADSALTLHGAIGYTWEHDLQLFYKRAKLNAYLFGTPQAWNERLASALPLLPDR